MKKWREKGGKRAKKRREMREEGEEEKREEGRGKEATILKDTTSHVF